ncbi:MAG TPA: GNAT family N-acetyltransferase [Sphingomicrobium sp.]|nr:GNAT family N-acetyltransferase [Sphingomicrobium sp.]
MAGDDVIRTERLVLRRARSDDASALHRLFTNPVAMRYWSRPVHEQMEQTENWLQSMLDPPTAETDDFIVTLDGALIGKLGCWQLPDVGFMLDPDLWGRGYAYEAFTAFIERRRRLGSSHLTADVDPENEASLRLLKRVGFNETGREARTWNIAGEWRDSVYLRLDLTT